jgi:microcompartment protein CcmK/EutM
MAEGLKDWPVDAAIVGIVDAVEITVQTDDADDT